MNRDNTTQSPSPLLNFDILDESESDINQNEQESEICPGLVPDIDSDNEEEDECNQRLHLKRVPLPMDEPPDELPGLEPASDTEDEEDEIVTDEIVKQEGFQIPQ